jgi:small conductance mechanosensitive channel
VVHTIAKAKEFSTERDEKQYRDTFLSITTTSFSVALWVIVTLTVLSQLGVDVMPLLAGAGVVGIAISFGAQTLVRDFLAGFFIIIEGQYRVGDVLEVNQKVSGVVEKITPRITVLRDLEGQVHYIPNGEITLATNMTMDYAQVDVTIGVSHSSDVDKVEKVINQVGKDLYDDKKWQGIALEPPYMLRLDSISESSLDIKILCKTAPIRQWDVKGELLRRLIKAFEKEGIDIPFPERTVHIEK